VEITRDEANVSLSPGAKEVKLETDGEPSVDGGVTELQGGEVGNQGDAVGPPTEEEFAKGNGGNAEAEGEPGTPVPWPGTLPPVPVCPKTDVVLGSGVKMLWPDPNGDVGEIPPVAVAPVVIVALGKGKGAPLCERGRPVEVPLSVADVVNILSVPVGLKVHVVFEEGYGGVLLGKG